MGNKGEFVWILFLLHMDYALLEDTCERHTCLGQFTVGHFLPRSIFTTKYEVSPFQCSIECRLRRPRCKSFNYRRSDLTCQLSEEDSGPDGIYLQPKPGKDHSNMDTWRNLPIGHCKEINCSWNERCDPSKSDPQSACVKTECPFAVLKPGVTIQPSSETEVGMKARYRCMSENLARGDSLTMCLASTAQWSPTDFKCVCKTTVKPGAIYETAELEVGQIYTYRCQDGLIGKRNQNPTVTCLQDGNWTPTNFACVCKTPPAKSGTINETAEVEIGQNYTYRCQDGLIGKRDLNPTVMCLPGGDWTTTNFTCVCKTPIAKSGTLFEPVEVEIGQNYTSRCQDGLIGKRDLNPTVTCLPDGDWTTTNFTCVCKTPMAKSGTINEAAEVELGQNYTYRCQDGLIGKRYLNPTVTCQPDGDWTTTNFSCVCKTPVKSGAINETKEVEIGQNYTYRCQYPLFEKGNQTPTVTCLHDGSWTTTNFVCGLTEPRTILSYRVRARNYICKVTQNWTQDKIYPKNIHTSEVISNETGIDFWECMQQCDDKLTKCLSFFYDNLNNHCVLSSSFKRGLPQGFQFSDELVYYTAPSTLCDMGYMNVLLGGSYFCIKYHSERKVFSEAMKICESEKAKLLVVTNKVPIDELTTFIGESGWVFIGVSDEISEENWVDWTGEAVSILWYTYEPNGVRWENCGAIGYRRNGVTDITCNNNEQFLCHKGIGFTTK